MSKKTIFSGWLILLIIVITGLLGPSVLAQDPAKSTEPTMDDVNDVARNLNCPTCQSLNLADCRTQTCDQWRDQIKDMLAEGYSEQEILDDYVARYGDEVLQEPPQRGVGLWVWVLPAVALLAGTIWVVLILKKWSTPKLSSVPIDSGLSVETEQTDDYLKRVQQDLENL